MDSDTPQNPQVRARIGMYYDVPTVASIEKGLREGRFLPADRLYVLGVDVGSLEETRPRWPEYIGGKFNDGDSGGAEEVHSQCPPARLEWRENNLYLVVASWDILIAAIRSDASARVTGRHPVDLYGVTPEEAFTRILVLLAIEGFTVPPLPEDQNEG